MEAVPLDPDTASVLSVQPACVSQMKELNLFTHQDIQPKDFSIATSRDSFHMFYTRQDYYLSFGATTKIIGHKRSNNLNDWFPTEGTMNAIQVRPGHFDSEHVWAPSIVRKPGDPTYYMFYTGVNASGIQRIGLATSFDLNIWAADTAAIYESQDVTWAKESTPDFRDAFVMADPDSVGRYVMYFVTESRDRRRLVVGLARTDPTDPADLRSWMDPRPLWNTDSLHTLARTVESPHAFADPGGRWWLFYSGYNGGPGQDSAFVSFETNDVSPADEDTTRWSAPDTLYKYVGGDQTLQFWHASEYFRASPGYEYLMAFNDNQHSIDIAQISWRSPHSFVLTDSCPPRVALGVGARGGDPALALRLLGPSPARGTIGFRIDMLTRTRAQLAVLDVAGRRIRTLLDEELRPGATEVLWDGRSTSGDAARGGVYFAKLTTADGLRVARVVLLR